MVNVNKERLEEMYSIFTTLHALGQMSDAVYMKCMLTLAADWAAQGEFAESMMLVSKVDRGYILGDLAYHMEGDQTFAVAVHGLAEDLVGAGLATAEAVAVDSFDMLSLTKPAQA